MGDIRPLWTRFTGRHDADGSGAPALSGLLRYASLSAVPFLFLFVTFNERFEINNDAYYHIKCASLYLQSGWLPKFPWMHSTGFPGSFVNTYWLTHLLLTPFAALSAEITSAKIAVVFLSTLYVYSIYVFLKWEGIDHPWLWSLIAVGISAASLTRLCFLKGGSVFYIILVWFVYFLIHERKPGLFFLSWVAVYLYIGFPILLTTSLLYVLMGLMTRRRLEWRIPLLVLAGIFLGLLLNPLGPDRWVLYYRELASSIVAPSFLKPGVFFGAEWMALSTSSYVKFMWSILSFVVLLSMMMMRYRTTLDSTTMFLWSLFYFIIIATCFSIKFIDYIPAVTVFAFGFTMSKVRHWPTVSRSALMLVLLIGVPLSISRTWADTHRLDEDDVPDAEFVQMGKFLRENTEELEPVVIPWDDFTRFFFYSDYNTYPVGMNPYYMLIHDDRAFTAFYYLYSGELSDPENALGMFFESRYIVVRREGMNTGEVKLLNQLRTSAAFEDAFETEHLVLFRLVPAE